jgi:uncharacterized alpha-E superfamily protein
MGVVLSKTNRLYWLGRYNERVYMTLKFIIELYDKSIDGSPSDYEYICKRLDIPCIYVSVDDFFARFLFDNDNPDSVVQNADRMLGNGMVLRETISSETLSYLQMAVNALSLAAKSRSPQIELQWVLDDIMAFRGSFDDHVEDERIRNMIKCGISVERISLYERLKIQRNESERELKKLVNRMYKTGVHIDPKAQAVIFDKVMNDVQPSAGKLLRAVETLFTLD